MATVFLKTLSIFAITVVGYIITKKGILPKETEPGIVNLLLLITTPCMIFNSLVTKELDPSISGKITLNMMRREEAPNVRAASIKVESTRRVVAHSIGTCWKNVPMMIIAILGASLIPRIATANAPNTGAGKYRKNSMKGPVNFSKNGTAPQIMPSGTPTRLDSKKARNTIFTEWSILS